LTKDEFSSGASTPAEQVGMVKDAVGANPLKPNYLLDQKKAQEIVNKALNLVPRPSKKE
jgi:hypothetical protein